MIFSPDRLDFAPCTDDGIFLSPAQSDRAIALSQQIPNPSQQWRVYLNGLALLGFADWLEEWGITYEREFATDSLLPPELAGAIAAVWGLRVNGFRLCLLVRDSVGDDFVATPRAVVELPEFAPHFYLLVEVLEEQNLVTVQGFLEAEVLRSRREELLLMEDWSWETPISWFDPTLENFFLRVRCMDANQFPLLPPRDRPEELATMREQLQERLPEIAASDRELWEILTWEAGVLVLTSPDLLNWIYHQQCQFVGIPLASESNLPLRDILQLLAQPAIDVGRWLRSELDRVARELEWVLLPDLTTVGAFRTTTEFTPLIRELQGQGVAIPPQARGAYQELPLGGYRLRLYAITWSLFPQSDRSAEWTLLLILGARSGSLPLGAQLRVSDLTGVLYEQTLESPIPYLFARVVGTMAEQFVVSVGLTTEEEVSFPPFGFREEGE